MAGVGNGVGWGGPGRAGPKELDTSSHLLTKNVSDHLYPAVVTHLLAHNEGPDWDNHAIHSQERSPMYAR